MLTDVAGTVGIDDVLRRHFPARHGALELLPVARTIDAEGSEVAGGARLGAYPTQGEGTLAILPHHRTMVGEMQCDFYIGRTADPDGFALLAHRRPAIRGPVQLRIARIQGLDVEILLVDSENGEAPGDLLVVARGDARQCGLDGANDIPTRGAEVDDIAQRGLRDHAMRIVGEHWLAARGESAGHRPIVAFLERARREGN